MLPSRYLVLERAVAAQASTQTTPILTWEEYREVAKLCTIYEEEDLRTATSFLHNLGSLVCFNDDEKVCLRSCSLHWLCRLIGVSTASQLGDPQTTVADGCVCECCLHQAQLLQVHCTRLLGDFTFIPQQDV